jgi:methyl-accepting chemotaxis protein
MQWFEAKAPIRLKMLVAFGWMIGLMVFNALVSFFGPNWLTLAIQAAVIVVAIILAARFRTAVCNPYVNTVVRMEGLAAGDLSGPIAYRNHEDCVGRMTKAMLIFRDTAVEQRKHATQQSEVVALFGQHLSQLSAGNLMAEIQQDVPPGYSELKSDFNAALESLRSLIGSVASSTDAIRSGAGEISQASEDLARRTEANAASLEQTSAAVVQMDGRLKSTADAAGRTVLRADGAISTVDQGRSIANEAVQAMARVADGAKSIDSVIEGLDKIAFQTRVLAMNATVEAGRAGDAGRGFAVVADLVSSLAIRSEEEAARARDQLTATQVDIVAAVEMVRKTEGALIHISDDVAEVHRLLSQMASDNQAQSVVISEISIAIGTMDGSTQQNAAMVEETSAAARNLLGEVSALAEQAAKFEVGDVTRKVIRLALPDSKSMPGLEFRSPIKALRASLMPQKASQDWSSF